MAHLQQRRAAGPSSTHKAVTSLLAAQRQRSSRRLTRPSAAASDTAAAAPSAAASATLCLKQWVAQHGLPSPAQLEPVLLDGRGHHRMLAAAPVQEGSLLLQVPERLMLTANSALASKHCGKLVRDAGLSEWQALVLHLLCERACGPDSFWAPYLAVLGDQATHPLMWGVGADSEQQQQLQGSAMLRTLQTRLQQVQEDTELLVAAGANKLPIAQAWQQQHEAPLVTPSSVCWAAAVLLDRCHSLDLSEPELPCEGDVSSYGSWQSHGPTCLCLVPWADMCRHSSSDAGPELMFDPEARAALLTADRDYAAGDEVVVSHGQLGLSAADLFLDHGCSSSNVAAAGNCAVNARYDMALTTNQLQPRGSRNTALLGALQALTGNTTTSSSSSGSDSSSSSGSDSSSSSGSNSDSSNSGNPAAPVPVVAVVSLTPQGPDAMGLAVLRAALASDAELIQAGWRTGSKATDVGLCARVMARLGQQPKSAATEGRLLAVLQGAVEQCLAAYPSTLQQDEEELAQLLLLAAADGTSQAQQQQQDQQQEQQVRGSILRGLISEKLALSGSRDVLLSWQQQLQALTSPAGGSSRAAAVKPEQLAAIYAQQQHDWQSDD